MRALYVREKRPLVALVSQHWARSASAFSAQREVIRRRRSSTTTTSHASYLETGHIEVGENEGLIFVNSKSYLTLTIAELSTVVLRN